MTQMKQALITMSIIIGIAGAFIYGIEDIRHLGGILLLIWGNNIMLKSRREP